MLFDSNEIYKKIIDDSLDGFFMLNDECCVVESNRSFQGMLGDILKKTENNNFAQILQGKWRKRFKEKVRIAFRKKLPQSTDIELINESGMMRYYLVSLNPFVDSTGRVSILYGFLKDITEMKRLQHLIVKERNYNRSIIETVNLGFVLVDDDNQYLDYNKAYLEILGREEYELVGKNFYDFTHPSYHRYQEKIMEEVRKTGKTITFEKEYVRRDGSRVPVLVTLSRLFDQNGKLIGSFAFIKDISAQKATEQKLRDQNERIVKLLEIYGAVSAKLLNIDSIREVYRLVTEAVLEIVGESSVELFAAGNNGFRSVFAHNVVQRKSGFFLREEQSMLIKRMITNPYPFYILNSKKEIDEREFKFFPQLSRNASAIVVPVSSGGELKGFMIVAFFGILDEIDNFVLSLLSGVANLASLSIEKLISQREQEAMRHALDRYERLTAMGRIIAGVAHEINNPLSIMQLDLDDLKQFCGSSCARTDEFNEIINSLEEEIARMSGIITQLKEYSRPEVIDGDERVSVDEIIRSYPLKIMLKNLRKKGIAVRTILGTENTYAKISKNKLLQVLMNLINNAEDALVSRHDPYIEIETRFAQKSRRSIAIIVRDNGIGIEEEDLSKIFEPFFTTKKSEGTGLGLSISYSIIKSCDGDIEVKSKKGSGSEFIVYLPVVESSQH
ncbi:MAG: PAS domain S-box protein [Spirochaetes bacterium]|nr:PAS domain S-box protein [Spirochaetota bacterium]